MSSTTTATFTFDSAECGPDQILCIPAGETVGFSTPVKGEMIRLSDGDVFAEFSQDAGTFYFTGSDKFGIRVTG